MGTAGLAEAPHDGLIVGLEEDQAGGNTALNAIVGFGKPPESLALTDIDDDGGEANGGRIAHQLREFRSEIDGKIVDCVIAQVFENLKDGSFAGPAHAGDDYQFRTGRG